MLEEEVDSSLSHGNHHKMQAAAAEEEVDSSNHPHHRCSNLTINKLTVSRKMTTPTIEAVHTHHMSAMAELSLSTLQA